ncbi:MAG: hypothetical protein RMY62_027410 [Nostoc sp. ZfuVER08]|jgi:hypothetical protein|uniref:Uncharacterized protein n=1 Tax=Nostoc punctiforme FACHB-252 TaxID=1357509 RepID=A0ABR8HFI5_NOSPU|nr:hypothetical protein [Nostoc punctiforme]MBD2614152.1 hypothetical protein [Nostoc punctiforme FACHB-252]MDZ8014975.1 hypothetical protein [Nostoc sp. ZfuVER08]
MRPEILFVQEERRSGQTMAAIASTNCYLAGGQASFLSWNSLIENDSLKFNEPPQLDEAMTHMAIKATNPPTMTTAGVDFKAFAKLLFISLTIDLSLDCLGLVALTIKLAPFIVLS